MRAYTNAETIQFEFHGKTFCLRLDEAKAAYHYMCEQKLLAEASRQVNQFVFGCDPDCLSLEAVAEQETAFQNENEFSVAELREHIPDIVAKYREWQDEETHKANFVIWADAIRCTIFDAKQEV